MTDATIDRQQVDDAGGSAHHPRRESSYLTAMLSWFDLRVRNRDSRFANRRLVEVMMRYDRYVWMRKQSIPIVTSRVLLGFR